jgi:hypothetical protein
MDTPFVSQLLERFKATFGLKVHSADSCSRPNGICWSISRFQHPNPGLLSCLRASFDAV